MAIFIDLGDEWGMMMTLDELQRLRWVRFDADSYGEFACAETRVDDEPPKINQYRSAHPITDHKKEKNRLLRYAEGQVSREDVLRLQSLLKTTGRKPSTWNSVESIERIEADVEDKPFFSLKVKYDSSEDRFRVEADANANTRKNLISKWASDDELKSLEPAELQVLLAFRVLEQAADRFLAPIRVGIDDEGVLQDTVRPKRHNIAEEED